MSTTGSRTKDCDSKNFFGSARGKFRSPLFMAPLAAVTACVLLVLIDPATGVYPPCPSQALLGVDCPACGGARATSALLRGDVSSFLNHNALLAVVFPLLIVLWALAVWQKLNPTSNVTLSRSASTKIWVGAALLAAIFTVARNIFPYWGSGIG